MFHICTNSCCLLTQAAKQNYSGRPLLIYATEGYQMIIQKSKVLIIKALSRTVSVSALEFSFLVTTNSYHKKPRLPSPTLKLIQKMFVLQVRDFNLLLFRTQIINK